MTETHQQTIESSPTGANTNPEAELKIALENAKYAALTSRARTEQANALVDHVLALLPEVPKGASGTANSKRARGTYAKTKAQRRRGVEGFLGDLLRAQNITASKGWVGHSLRPARFKGAEVGYKAFKHITDRLIALKLVEVKGGFQKWSDGFGDGPLPTNHRYATRFRATEELMRASAEHGVTVTDALAHFVQDLPKNPLVLKTSSSRRDEYGYKTRGKRMPFEPTTLTGRLEAQVRDLNEFFDGFSLRGGTHRGFVRIFNQGDVQGFRWNKGGRLYSQGDDAYQLLSPEERLRMTINGEPVCEIDIRASYLTIFHAWHGEAIDLSTSPYKAPLGEEAERVVKDWCVATFGSDGHLTKWPPKIVSKYRERTNGRTLGNDYPLKKVRAAVIEAFPVLSQWGEKDRGWGDLMYLESVAMISTMTDLMTKHSVPSLSVHDSLIVPASRRALAEETLAAQYRWATGATPKLVTHLPLS